MKVIAATGIKVPKEDRPHDYVTDSEAVDVPESSYYLRRLADGDLLLAEAAAEPKTTKRK